MKKIIEKIVVKISLCILLIFVTDTKSECQNIFVIHIEGNARMFLNSKESKLVHGPINEKSVITLDKNARVKLIRSKSEICDLKSPGKYNVNKLTYENTGNNSILGRFCDYFHSFFTTHSSPEAKSTYKNSISAISRGNMTVPNLDFPLQGALANDEGPLTFSWSHHCDTCTYMLSVFDFTTKKEVYHTVTKSKDVTILQPDLSLQNLKKYYWKVEVKGHDLEYLVNSFSISQKGNYAETIAGIEYNLGIDEFKWVTITPRTIYIMSELAAQKHLNYAIQFGRAQQKAYPGNKELDTNIDNMLFSHLINGTDD